MHHFAAFSLFLVFEVISLFKYFLIHCKIGLTIMFWFNQLMGSGLFLFQVVMMTQLQLSHQPFGEPEDAWLNSFW